MSPRIRIPDDWPYRLWLVVGSLPFIHASVWMWSSPLDPGIASARIAGGAMLITILYRGLQEWPRRADLPIWGRSIDRLWFAGLALDTFLAVWSGAQILREVDPEHLVAGTLAVALALIGIWMVYERHQRALKPEGSVPRQGWTLIHRPRDRQAVAAHELGHWIVLKAGPVPVKARVSLQVPSAQIAGQVSWSGAASDAKAWHYWRRLTNLAGMAAEELILPERLAAGASVEDLVRWEDAARLDMSHDPEAAWFIAPRTITEDAANARSLAERRVRDFAAATAILRTNRAILDELLPVLMQRGEMDDAALAPWAARIVPMSAMPTDDSAQGQPAAR